MELYLPRSAEVVVVSSACYTSQRSVDQGRVTAVALGSVDGRGRGVGKVWMAPFRLWDVRTHFEEVVVSLGAAIFSIAHQSHAGIAVGTQTGLFLLECRETGFRLQHEEEVARRAVGWWRRP
jgi:hypothetical protein